MPNDFIDELGINSKLAFRFVTTAVILTITIGTFFYHEVEGWSWVDSYYFSVVTLATVGYGDLTPKTVAGKLFTTVYIFTGVGLLAAYFGILMRRRWKHRADHYQKRHSEVEAAEKNKSIDREDYEKT